MQLLESSVQDHQIAKTRAGLVPAPRKSSPLAKLYGGQGTINVPSWSPDSRNVAFVSYQPVFE